MKKKTLLVLLIILLTVLLSTVVFATMNNAETQQILTNKKLSSIGETYTEIDDGITTFDMRANQNIIGVANTYINDLKITDVEFTNENSQIKKYNNALESRKETVISNEQAVLKVNSENDELIAYISNKTDFASGEYNEDEVKNKAINIFNNLTQINQDEYEFMYVEKFDEEIWRASFAKKYNGMINEGESVKFSFCPKTNEIVTLAINRTKYANNTVEISKDTATKIAEKYLNKSTATDMDIDLEIVRPNYFYNELNGDESIYVKIGETRQAYVAKFNNESASTLYIDATTGEIIGGDMILGSEY